MAKTSVMFWQKKSSVILFVPEKEEDRSAKNEFFKKALADGAEEVPEFSLCLKVLEDEQTLRAIQAEANQRKIKETSQRSIAG